MIKDHTQKQKSGNYSINLQGHSIIINQGITCADAKTIALNVFKANFMQLSKNAAKVAIQRAEELTDAFLSKLMYRLPDDISSMEDPGMQIALYTAQRAYARTGDKDLEELLIDILVERTKQKELCEERIVLDESLNVVSKLTVEHLDALTVILLLLRTKNITLSNSNELNKFIDNKLLPFMTYLSPKTSCYEHLEYAGCGSIMRVARWASIEDIFHIRFANLFSMQSPREIREYLSNIRPQLQKLFAIWDDSSISRFDLTTVGVAIAQANFTRKTGERLQTTSPIIAPYVDGGKL